ncbi:MAG: DUF4364 family protein [Defluviitaleaceae bacterium]|nr:DUF4364 family protein [Defluviitaleaceae bacterium]MCL2835142.1 DUF4364 family protein [Defluviitaleaceae bacterium]
MIQQNLYPDEENSDAQLTKKITLLYLVNKFDIPLASTHITQFALEQGLMNYYQVLTYLQEMVDVGYLDKSSNHGSNHFTITGDGAAALESFIKLVNNDVKNKVTKFAGENRRNVKKDFENIANHFYDRTTKEYIVKCGVYEEDMTLMELNLSVVSKEQAVAICTNWKANVAGLYGEILGLLLKN